MMARGKAKLVPTPVGGMAVTTSPSGKNYPWEVGFNHHSSPDILEVPAMSSCHAEMIIEPDGLVVDLPDIRRARRINARAAKLEAVDLLRTELTKKLEEANALAASLGISLSVSENAQQGAV